MHTHLRSVVMPRYAKLFLTSMLGGAVIGGGALIAARLVSSSGDLCLHGIAIGAVASALGSAGLMLLVRTQLRKKSAAD